MAEIKAELNYLRASPRKIRLVADLIRGKNFEDAEKQLLFLTKSGAKPLLKLLQSAVANAKHNFKLNEKNLYVKKITVNQGPVYKRRLPRARGMTSPIRKKTSHIALTLEPK